MQEQRLGTILWRGRYLVLLAVAATVVVALIATQLSPRVYEATELLRVDQATSGATGSDTFNAQQTSQALARTYSTLLDSRSFLARISPRVANGRYDAAELQERVNAQAVKDTSLVSLGVKADSPAQAKVLATDIATQTIKALDEDSSRQLDDQQRVLQTRIAKVTSRIQTLGPPQSAADRDRLESLRLSREALIAQLRGILGEGIARAPHLSVAAPPSAPADPVEPRPLLNLVAALVLGSLIGGVLAWIRDRTNTKLRSSREATALVPAPVLGSIPLRRSSSLDDPLVRNAFQVLRANLGATAPDGDRGQIVVVTGADPGADKSSVARGLAEAAADAGTHALLIDGDLRGRKLSRDLGYGNTRGFSDAAGSLKMDPPIVLAPGGAPLLFLPAGTPVPSPPSLLKSSAVRQLLDAVRRAGRLIIVETPAAGALPDASLLAAHADCVLIVARTGATNRGHLTSVVNAFDRPAQGRVVGLVVIEPGPPLPAVREVGRNLVSPAVRE